MSNNNNNYDCDKFPVDVDSSLGARLNPVKKLSLNLAVTKKSPVKIKSSDGEEFSVDAELVDEMETIKTMTLFGNDDDLIN